jgi:glyoxylase-like metal-dependent hydrolase (beta-lactamase superfamily II)
MSIVTCFTFNPFQENTYVVHDAHTLEGIIVDPGCHSDAEKEELSTFIAQSNLKITCILNTHCHLDHVFGNAFVKERYPDAPLCIHRDELVILDNYPKFAAMYGVPAEPSPKPDLFLEPGNYVFFGQARLKILFTPGHSPASVSFYCDQSRFVLGGDVLFHLSIGRTDLPGGDYDTLIESIHSQFLQLPDSVLVYSGHGPQTTIGFEKENNPFLINN